MLMALTLRDWMEGDGTIGFGKSKGYGGFRARCEVLSAGPEAETLRGILHRNVTILGSPELEQWGRSLDAITRVEEAV